MINGGEDGNEDGVLNLIGGSAKSDWQKLSINYRFSHFVEYFGGWLLLEFIGRKNYIKEIRMLQQAMEMNSWFLFVGEGIL